MTDLYFGCWGRLGHYFWLPGMTNPRAERTDATDLCPWGYTIDGGLLDKHAGQREGVARVYHRDGWTALAFWDRSVDKRGGSHSTFVFDADLTPEAALARAREVFPEVFARYPFEVVLA